MAYILLLDLSAQPRKGEMAFANKPVRRTDNSVIGFQIIEIFILNILKLQSLIATKGALS